MYACVFITIDGFNTLKLVVLNDYKKKKVKIFFFHIVERKREATSLFFFFFLPFLYFFG